MSLHTLFRPLFGSRKPMARLRRTVLNLERFEDRTVPAGFFPNVEDVYVGKEVDFGTLGNVDDCKIEVLSEDYVGLQTDDILLFEDGTAPVAPVVDVVVPAVQDPFSSGHVEKVGVVGPEC